MDFHKHLSARTRTVLAATAAAAICVPLVGATPASTGSPSGYKPLVSKSGVDHKQSRVYIGPTGNRVEVVDPGKSTYVPKIGQASAKDKAKAQRLLDGANKFCKTHTAKSIKENWSAGGMGKGMMGGMHMKGMSGMHMAHMNHKSSTSPTHYFSSTKAKAVSALHPTAALIYKGHLDGVMINGKPLPYLGSIPRAHTHERMINHPIEMVHVYCTNSLKTAFTPNRMLGVKLATIDLRNKIRPAVMDLSPRHLREVRDLVRGFLTHKDGPKPALQAMRTEIRQALMRLSENQLRQVWTKMQSYHH